MASYKLSNAAERDIESIYEYSLLEFGEAVGNEYIDGLFIRLGLLAANPSWGNDYSHIAARLMRYEHKSHSIYYQLQSSSQILIVRILGKRQDPARHM